LTHILSLNPTESPRRKQQGIIMDYLFYLSPQGAGNLAQRDY
jgi:hypothetical protein